MRIKSEYSHFNAAEFLSLRKKEILPEITSLLECNIPSSDILLSQDEGILIYDNLHLMKKINATFKKNGWVKQSFRIFSPVVKCVTFGEENIAAGFNAKKHSPEYFIRDQTGRIVKPELTKNKTMIDIRFTLSENDLHTKYSDHVLCYSAGHIDCSIILLPVKGFSQRLKYKSDYFEKEISNILADLRTNPPVPLLILGIEP